MQGKGRLTKRQHNRQSESRRQIKARVLLLEQDLAKLAQVCQQNFSVLMGNDQTNFELNQTNSVVAQGVVMAVEDLLEVDTNPWMQKAMTMLREKQLAKQAQQAQETPQIVPAAPELAAELEGDSATTKGLLLQ